MMAKVAAADPAKVLKEPFRLARELKHAECIELLSGARSCTIARRFKLVEHDAWYLMGDCFVRLLKYEEAYSAFSEALRCRPSDRDSILALGNCLSELGEHSRAASCFGFVCEIDETDAEARYNYANELLDLGMFSEAIQNYEWISTQNVNLKRLISKNLKLARSKRPKQKK
jgi:tetratricopeptide (TPR) repeat protein